MFSVKTGYVQTRGVGGGEGVISVTEVLEMQVWQVKKSVV